MATLEASAPKLEDRLTIAARCAWSSSMFFQQPGVQDVKWNQSVIVVVEDNLRALEDYINVEDKDQYVFHLNAPNLPTCTFREKLNNALLRAEVLAALVDEMNELALAEGELEKLELERLRLEIQLKPQLLELELELELQPGLPPASRHPPSTPSLKTMCRRQPSPLRQPTKTDRLWTRRLPPKCARSAARVLPHVRPLKT